ATNWSVTSASHHFGLVAQTAERPVVCGRVEGANPFESAKSHRGPWSKDRQARLQKNQAPGALPIAGANSAWCSSNMPGLEPGDRRCKSCRADHFLEVESRMS